VAAFSMLQSLIVPVMPEIARHYDTDESTVTWVLTAYLVSAAVCTPLIGRVGDAYGKTRMLAIALGALCLGSLMGALAPSIGWLIAARVVQGVGGGVLPLAFGIVRDELGSRTTTALSVLSSLLAVGYGFGIVVAGPILTLLGYSWLYWLPLIVTGATALATLALVPESRERTSERVPLVPAVLLSAALTALLIGLSQGPSWGWASVSTLGLLALAAVAGTAWVRSERTAKAPLIDMGMMRVRGVWTANAIGAAVGFSMFASFGFLPRFLQTPSEAGYGFGASVMESGLLILPSQICAFAAGFLTAPFVMRLGTRVTLFVGCLCTGLSMLGLGLWHDTTAQVIVATALQGAGSGLVFATLAGVLVGAVPPSQTAVASAVNANMRSVFGALGATLMGVVVTAHLDGSDRPLESGYTAGYLVLAAVMIVGVVVSLLVPDRRGAGTDAPWQDAVDAELGLVPNAPIRP
jgi:MFS family permease